MGSDQANLDLTDYLNTNNIPHEEQKIAQLVNSIREEILIKTGGLTASCGVGPNKMLAKICSEVNKPNGQYIMLLQ